jgi:hypothetical protein
MEFKNVRVYGLKESMIASGLPKAVNTEKHDKLMEDIIPATDVSKVESRCTKLGNVPVGTGHDCFLKGIKVQVDVKYTQYWSMQFQRYHFADIISSQSKMHRIIEMGLTEENTNGYVSKKVIDFVNDLINAYKITSNHEDKKILFKRIMANIPMGFMLWMRIDLNYLQLKTIYKQRVNSDAKKIDEDWGHFCEWCLTLPMFKELCIK